MSIINKIDDTIYDLATLRQKEVIDTVRAYSTLTEAGKELGLAASNVHHRLQAAITRAARKGYCPEQGLDTPYPDGFLMEKVTIHERGGKVTETWARMCADKEKALAMLRLAITAICEDVQPLAATSSAHTQYCEEDLMVNIPVGDAHIGMLAWGEECGEDYDLSIAESIHCQAIDMLIAQAPNAKYCTIIDLGDWMHADNVIGITTRGGNVLDMDGRWHKVLRCAIRIVIYYITQCLKKFDYVTFRPEIGNHNDTSAIATQEWLSILYANEPRVTIGNTPGNVYFWQHGLCFFGSHHGHEIKFDKLPGIMAAKIMDDHIETKYRKFYCGHIHHKTMRASDFQTCEVQTYRTLAPKDAYASSHGYVAPRDITAETWHKKYGHMGTVNINIPMMEASDE
jgi:hypothetical protein